MDGNREETERPMVGKGVKIFAGVVFGGLILLVLGVALIAKTTAPPAAAPVPAKSVEAKADSSTVEYLRRKEKEMPAAKELSPAEEKRSFIASAAMIGEKGKGRIYIKDFVKNPDRYRGDRVKINVKILKIEEQDGRTLMNVYLSRRYEVGIITYQGTTDVYQDDIICVYGNVIGNIEGTNAMGAAMHWPAIEARYIKKLRTDDEN